MPVLIILQGLDPPLSYTLTIRKFVKQANILMISQATSSLGWKTFTAIVIKLQQFVRPNFLSLTKVMGMGPLTTRPGDLVFMLRGGSIPFVLRHLGQRPEVYLLKNSAAICYSCRVLLYSRHYERRDHGSTRYR